MINRIEIGKGLAVAMIVLSVGACVGYGLAGDWRRSVYWAAAAVITGVVTF